MSNSSVLKKLGVGRRHPSDELFSEGNTLVRAHKREGVIRVDDEDLCHELVKKFQCQVFGCAQQFDTVMQFELHYNSSHRYHCSQCKKQFFSSHLLDLHVSEKHDSFFLAMAERKPMYQCFVQECKSVFSSVQERHDHCVCEHNFPRNFKFDYPNKQKSKKSDRNVSCDSQMEVEANVRPS